MWKRIVTIGETFETQFETQRQVERDRPRGRDRLWVPPGLYCLVLGEVVTVVRFLSCLATTVPTGTRLVLWNLEKLSIPVKPVGIEM